MPELEKLDGITPDDIAAMRSKGIRNTDDLWTCLGENKRRGVVRLARLTGIPRARLIAILALLTVRKTDPVDGSRQERIIYVAALILALLLVALLGLALRMLLPPPLGLQETVVIAVHDLRAGEMLHANDLTGARLHADTNSFTDTRRIEDLVLAQNVSSGTPLHFEDVLRPQVAARGDIATGTIIARDMISVTWSAFEPDARLQTDQVVGRRALKSIKNGEVILSDFIDVNAETALQVVVSATAGLPAFHVITRDEITLKETIKEAGAFNTLDAVEGGYLLQAVSQGVVLRANQLMPKGSLTGRQILSVPIGAGALGPTVVPGTRVTLRMNLRSQGEISIPPAFEDVIVLATDRRDGATSLLVALRTDQAAAMLPLLGKADVFVVQTSP